MALPYLLPTIYYLLFLGGCATTGLVKAPSLTGVPGIYHRAEKGQTLFLISKMYGIDIDELAQVNHVSDASDIEIGQFIFIPNRQKPVYSQPAASGNEDFIWPIKGRVISNFGSLFNNMLNRGINIQPYADKEIIASRSGKVVFYSPNFLNYGKTLIIDHGDGFSSVYARMLEVFSKVGENVRKGEAIARVGFSDRDKSEYLHFEIRKGYLPQNPKFYLP
jgi:murein DD-endopeptidase MepM/ murein hydrolase activator NlpD